MKLIKYAKDELIKPQWDFRGLNELWLRHYYMQVTELIQNSKDKLQDTVVEWEEEVGSKGLELNIKKSKVMHVGRKGEQRTVGSSQEI